MTIRKNGAVVRQLRTLFQMGAIGELTDGQLLERFATGRGEAAELAFAVLVERHGPMVLRVCRRVLVNEHDTQDAFQATFLVLVRKARGLWVRDSLGPWLHQAAFRTASCARAAAVRRRRHEHSAALAVAVAVAAREDRVEANEEMGRLLHAEIERLPERYRVPVVLCDLQGRSHEQAARHLGWPVGTVKSRLTRGRQRLRDRLQRRGLAPDAGLLALLRGAGAGGPVAALPVPTALVESTAGAAVQLATAGTIVPGSAAMVAQGVLRTMFLTQCLKVASVVLVVGATASGVGLVAQQQEAGAEALPDPAPPGARVDGLPVHTVQPAALRVTVVAKGVVEACRSETVTCQVEGGATIIGLVPEGAKVKKGQLVGELDSSRLMDDLKNQRIATLGAQAAYENAKLTREVAEIAVIEYEEGIYMQEKETVLGEIALAKAERNRAEDRVALSDRRLAKGEISKAQNIADKVDLRQKVFAYEQAQTKKDVLEKYTKDKTLKELQAEVEKAKADELVKKQAWDREKDRQDELERQVPRYTLLAPGDGVVVHGNDPDHVFGPPLIVVGGKVRERQIILWVRDVDGPMRANVKVPEAVVDQVWPEMAARISLEAFPGRILTGKVESINPLPDVKRSYDHGVDKLYTCRVSIDGGPAGLRPGMAVQVEVLVRELDHVLTVPITAVRHFDGKDHVAVKKPGGGLEWRTVTLGASSDTSIEVKEGLQRGAEVIPRR